MTRLEDMYGQTRTILQNGFESEYIVKESFPKTRKTYSNEKTAINVARQELKKARRGIIAKHYGFIRTR